MLVGDSVIGAISIQSCAPNAFDEGHSFVWRSWPPISFALNNARLYERASGA